MKNILKLFLITLAVTLTASCSVDQVGEKYIDGVRGVTFDNAKYTTEIPTSGTEIEVRVSRVSAVEAAVVGLTNDCVNPEIFTIPQTVTFAAGEFEKYVKIAVDTDEMFPGKTYSFKLNLEEIASLSGITTTTITLGLELIWIPAGSAELDSDWFEMAGTVPVERAEGTNIYRLVSPYWHFDPDYILGEGYHVMFEVDGNFDAVAQFPSDIGEVYSGDQHVWLVSTGYEGYGCSFTNVGNVYTVDGIWGTGTSADALTLRWYALEVFEWNR
jgi:hypothetical protein